ncbi:hypothetical protein E4U10_000946 [Claviceps purpurea]|nr:hypothetical protein E4U10_000946 [Claviceps purpurea]
MDQLFIDAIEQNPTASYLTGLREEAEKMGVRHSGDLDNLGKGRLFSLYFSLAWGIIQQAKL